MILESVLVIILCHCGWGSLDLQLLGKLLGRLCAFQERDEFGAHEEGDTAGGGSSGQQKPDLGESSRYRTKKLRHHERTL